MSTSTLTATTTRPTRRSSNPGWVILSGLTAVAMGAVIGAALLYAKPALNLAGDEQAAQRIFYIHMGSVICAHLPSLSNHGKRFSLKVLSSYTIKKYTFSLV